MDQNLTNLQQMVVSVWNQYEAGRIGLNPTSNVQTVRGFANWILENTTDICGCCGQKRPEVDRNGVPASIDWDEDREGNRVYYGLLTPYCSKCNEGGCMCDELRDLAAIDQTIQN